MYAPISYGPLPFLAFKLPEDIGASAAGGGGAMAVDGKRAALAAAGTVRGCDPDRIILKKITLTGG